MKKILSIITAAVIISSAAYAQVSADIADKCYKIMQESEDIQAYHGDYSATLSLVVEKPGKPKENIQYKIFQRTDAKLMTIVQLFPDADKGKGFLRNDDNIWSYDPISRKFTHISIKEALGDSDVKLDDVDRNDKYWRENYEVFSYEEGTLGKYPVDIIVLKAKTKEPSYAKTKVYMRKDIPLVLKQEDYSGSDRLMRTTLVPKWSKVEVRGKVGYVASQTIFRDELNKGEQTQNVISDLTFDTLPDKIFTKAYLEGLN